MLIDKAAIVLYNNITVNSKKYEKNIKCYKNRRYLEMILDVVVNFRDIIITKEFDNLWDSHGIKYSKVKEEITILNICKALKESKYEKAFVISCNTPLVSREFIEKMASIDFDEDALVVYVKGKIQPFCAIYQKRIIPYIEDMVRKNIYSMDQLLKNISVRYVFPKNEELFININTIEEYARLGKKVFIKDNI